jgi:hypothetical protein
MSEKQLKMEGAVGVAGEGIVDCKNVIAHETGSVTVS